MSETKSDFRFQNVEPGDWDFEILATEGPGLVGSEVHRLRQLAKRERPPFIARVGDEWGIAAPSLDRLRKIYRDEPHDGLYRMEAHYFQDRRRTPDVVLFKVEEGTRTKGAG